MPAVLGLAGALVGPAAVTARPAAAAVGPDCVALVVDPAPGAARTGCVTWTATITGSQVLERAGHSLRFRPSDGLICQLDNTPTTCSADATHYWSYWHRPPGGSAWTYSTEGAGTYHPAKNSTEGWAYLNGGSRQPANVPFATICPPPAPPAPAPRPATPTPRPAPPPAHGSSRPPVGPAPDPAAPGTATGPASGPPRPPAAGTTGTTGTTGRSSSRSPSAVATTPAASPGGSSATTPLEPVSAPGRSGGPPIATLLGLALVAAVAGAGGWVAWARRAGRE